MPKQSATVLPGRQQLLHAPQALAPPRLRRLQQLAQGSLELPPAPALLQGEGAADGSGPADVPKLTFTIDGHHLSPTTTIFQAVQVGRCLLAIRWIVWNLSMRILAVVNARFT